jgi:hypothetical protein
MCLQTDGHGETSIPLYNFVAGGIIKFLSTSPSVGNQRYHKIKVVWQSRVHKDKSHVIIKGEKIPGIYRLLINDKIMW